MPQKKKHSQNSKSILFLLTQDLESPSGLGRYYPLCKNLVRNGYIVEIAALHSNFGALEKKNMDMEGVKVSYVAQMHVKKIGDQTEYFHPIRLLWYSVVATWRLLMIALKNPTDILVIGKPHPMNSVAGLLAGKFHRAKIILDCDDYEAVSNYFSSSWQKFVIKLFEDTMPKLVHKVVTNTMFNKDRMVDLGIKEEKIVYLPNGVDPGRFKNINHETRQAILEKLNLIDQKVIIYVGSLNITNHPVDLLIKAFKEIILNLSNVKLLIVGGGKDIDLLKQLTVDLGLDEITFFTGRIRSSLVAYYYDIADISVDPVHDRDEAKGRCPLKMFESWVMNTPFITSDVGDRRMLAGEYAEYTLALPGDHIDLARKILVILNDRELASEISSAYKRSVEEFFWDKMVIDKQSIFN